MGDDPFLLDHEVRARQYEISVGYQQVSVRDQLLRGIEAAKRLVAFGIVPKEGGRLLVVGGGVAGFAAALEAVSQGVSVMLLESADRPFTRFAQCTTRRVDPTFYDWPLPHWRRHIGEEGATSLVFSAGTAATLGERWASIVNDHQRLSKGRLDIRYGATFDPQRLISAHTYIAYTLPGATNPDRFDVVIYAAGMGREKVWLHDELPPREQYLGPNFWDSDDLHKPWCGMSKQPAVLIAGSGDGALQDYIRIVTGQHPAEVLEHLDDALSDQQLWQQTQYALLASQEIAARQYSLGCRGNSNSSTQDFHRKRDLKIIEALHRQFEVSVASLYREQQSIIDRVLHAIVKQRQLPSRLHLLIHGKAFTWCYASNRFLVLLLDRYLMPANHRDTFLLNETLQYRRSLLDVEPLLNGYRVVTNNGEPMLKQTRNYDVVIIRRGIEPPARLYTPDRSTRERGLLPYAVL